MGDLIQGATIGEMPSITTRTLLRGATWHETTRDKATGGAKLTVECGGALFDFILADKEVDAIVDALPRYRDIVHFPCPGAAPHTASAVTQGADVQAAGITTRTTVRGARWRGLTRDNATGHAKLMLDCGQNVFDLVLSDKEVKAIVDTLPLYRDIGRLRHAASSSGSPSSVGSPQDGQDV